MIEKEFVLVSQGIEIMRTKSQEKAINIVKKENDEYFDYQQKCYDNYERPADSYIELEIEYSDEKEKDKEIERLNNLLKETSQTLSKQTTKAITLKSENERLNNELKSLQDSYDIEEQANYHIDLTDDLREEVDRLKNDIKRITEITNQKIKIINDIREYMNTNVNANINHIYEILEGDKE